MIKTSQDMTEYYSKPNQIFYGPQQTSRDHPYVITNRSQRGEYNVTERDYGDRKVSYFIPAEYENRYDPAYLDDGPAYDRYNTPILVRRRYYRSADDAYPYYEEEVPMASSRRYAEPPPLLPKRPRVIKRVYFQPSPTPPPVQYVYEDEHKPNNQEHVPVKPKV